MFIFLENLHLHPEEAAFAAVSKDPLRLPASLVQKSPRGKRDPLATSVFSREVRAAWRSSPLPGGRPLREPAGTRVGSFDTDAFGVLLKMKL
jgi:hypothetical protein